MEISLSLVAIAVLAFVVLRLLRHSRYAVYFHLLDTPISAKQWLQMTHEEKHEYLYGTFALGFKYYNEIPAVWMTDSGAEIEKTVESAIRATDVSATLRMKDATFGRGVRIATFDTVKQLLKQVRTGKVTGPKLTGNEWLSWSLEKKQTLVADYITLGLLSIGIDKKSHPAEVSLLYIESIDKAAENHREDPRMNRFIGNLMNEMMKKSIEEFNRLSVKN